MPPAQKGLLLKVVTTLLGLAFLGFIFLRGESMGMVFTSGGFRYIIAIIIGVLLADMWRN